jgi:hypothetical protein
MSTFYSETSLTEDQVINIIREEAESLFPKNCTACGHRFYSLKEYLENTVHLGKPRCYDAEVQAWQPHDPMGIFAFSNCKNCGNTLTISSSKTNIMTMWQLLEWIKNAVLRRGVASDELLNGLRATIENQVLNEECPS